MTREKGPWEVGADVGQESSLQRMPVKQLDNLLTLHLIPPTHSLPYCLPVHMLTL